MRRFILFAAAAAVCVLPGSAMASAKSMLPSGSLVLDGYAPKGQEPFAQTSFTIPKDVWYVATVSGTISYYAADWYTHPRKPFPIVCGTPEPATQYKGSQGGDGPVGIDAEFVFARPWTASRCRRGRLPVQWSNFKIFAGWSFAHPDPLGPNPSAPAPNHTYKFPVISGRGSKVKFRLLDTYTPDNYGVLHITVRPATQADCVYYSGFHYKSQADCLASDMIKG